MQKAMGNPKRRAALGLGLEALIPVNESADSKEAGGITYLQID